MEFLDKQGLEHYNELIQTQIDKLNTNKANLRDAEAKYAKKQSLLSLVRSITDYKNGQIDEGDMNGLQNWYDVLVSSDGPYEYEECLRKMVVPIVQALLTKVSQFANDKGYLSHINGLTTTYSSDPVGKDFSFGDAIDTSHILYYGSGSSSGFLLYIFKVSEYHHIRLRNTYDAPSDGMRSSTRGLYDSYIFYFKGNTADSVDYNFENSDIKDWLSGNMQNNNATASITIQGDVDMDNPYIGIAIPLSSNINNIKYDIYQEYPSVLGLVTDIKTASDKADAASAKVDNIYNSIAAWPYNEKNSPSYFLNDKNVVTVIGCNASYLDCTSMFRGCSNLKYLPDFSKVVFTIKNASNMFQNCTSLESIDMSNKVVEKSVSFTRMFSGCRNLKSVKLGDATKNVWLLDKNNDFSYMFYTCRSLLSSGLNMHLTATRPNMLYMFFGCSQLTSIDLSGISLTTTELQSDGETITTLPEIDSTKSMFTGCTNLKTVYVRKADLSTWQSLANTGASSSVLFVAKS